jgi:chromosome segregation ATPase
LARRLLRDAQAVLDAANLAMGWDSRKQAELEAAHNVLARTKAQLSETQHALAEAKAELDVARRKVRCAEDALRATATELQQVRQTSRSAVQQVPTPEEHETALQQVEALRRQLHEALAAPPPTASLAQQAERAGLGPVYAFLSAGDA